MLPHLGACENCSPCHLDTTPRPCFNVATMTNVANRIVEIQRQLTAGTGDSYELQREQRRLWAEHYPDASFDKIRWDSWAHRRPELGG